jgi:hypothetical protein
MLHIHIFNNNITAINFMNTDKSNIQEMLIGGNQFPVLDFSEFPALTDLEPDTMGWTDINIAQNPLLEILVAYSNSFTSVDISNNPLLTDVQLDVNQLTVSAVNNILIQLDNNGLLNGNCALHNQTPAAPPSGAGATAKANLIGKGWTVNTN